MAVKFIFEINSKDNITRDAIIKNFDVGFLGLQKNSKLMILFLFLLLFIIL
jgi:hypothetical protein